jgi:hypothetical protein
MAGNIAGEQGKPASLEPSSFFFLLSSLYFSLSFFLFPPSRANHQPLIFIFLFYFIFFKSGTFQSNRKD